MIAADQHRMLRYLAWNRQVPLGITAHENRSVRAAVDPICLPRTSGVEISFGSRADVRRPGEGAVPDATEPIRNAHQPDCDAGVRIATVNVETKQLIVLYARM